MEKLLNKYARKQLKSKTRIVKVLNAACPFAFSLQSVYDLHAIFLQQRRYNFPPTKPGCYVLLQQR